MTQRRMTSYRTWGQQHGRSEGLPRGCGSLLAGAPNLLRRFRGAPAAGWAAATHRPGGDRRYLRPPGCAPRNAGCRSAPPVPGHLPQQHPGPAATPQGAWEHPRGVPRADPSEAQPPPAPSIPPAPRRPPPARH